MAFYEGIDKKFFDAGTHYRPMNQFLLNQDETVPTPVEEETEVTTSYGIPNTNKFVISGDGGGGGGSFGPYKAQSYGDFVTNRSSIGSTGYIQGLEPEETYMDKIGGLIKSGIGMAIPGANFLMNMAPSREKRLNAIDNAFIDMQLANQEQAYHGMGNLTNQDRYGYNKDSMFGNYADKVKERADIARQKAKDNANDPNYQVRPIDAYYLEKEKEQEDTKKQVDFNNFLNQRITANKLRAQQAKGIDTSYKPDIHPGGDNTTTTTTTNVDQSQEFDGTPSNDTAWTDSFSGDHDYGGGGEFDMASNDSPSIDDVMARGGRVGYNRGRVVNPGGYAGDDEGGILEWIKSKMGSESETNPTVFGTQNSLLNQGSIAQLKDAIKSYEALMYMGELDEEQQADYELKLNQLEALEQGAQGQAQGGRVGLRYGGLLSIL